MSIRLKPGFDLMLLRIIRLAVGAIFLWSGVSKIQRPYDFLADVYRYELVGPTLGVAVAVAVPWLEFVVGACLLGGTLLTGAFLASTLLAAVFTFANAYAIRRGLEINCGCFGGDGDKVGYATLARAGCLLLIAAAGWLLALRGPLRAKAALRSDREDAPANPVAVT